ncbi:MAG: glycosyl hydrolase [bacterium]|nr:glycosyl hydrolase [bacterium]
MKKNSFSFEEFEKSPKEYRPVPFLFLNHKLEDDELRWQVKEIKEKGNRGFFMHPRPGLLTPYMSVEFREKIKLMVQEAEKLGIEAWLYDEDPYPSGAAGGKVIYHHPEFRSRKLVAKTQSVKGKTTVSIDFPMGHIVGIFAINHNKQVVDLTEYAGPIRDKWGYVRRYDTYYGSMRADTFPHWRSDATGIKNRFEWNVPDGDWKIFIFVECYEMAYWGPWGGYIDILNPDAVEDFIEKTHEVYKKDLGKYFGKTIPGIFTDEPKWIGWLPWSPKLPEFFRKSKGYEIIPVLYMLLEGDSEKERKVRFDYWDVLTQMLKKSFFDRISRWCENNKISFTGHVSPEEEPDLGVVYLGDLMQHAKAFQIPGTDIITPRIGTDEFPIVSVGPKLISSVARQQGRERVLSECFALEEWDFTLERTKRIADYMMALGINFINQHGFYYSIDGHRKKEAIPSQFYQTTYWQYYEDFSRYIGRVCYMLTRFDYPVEFALLYPTSSLWQILPEDTKKAKALSDAFVFINHILVHSHRFFDFVDDIDFMKAEIENGLFIIGKMKYNALVVPPIAYPVEPLVEKLKEFTKHGGRVLFLGERIEGIKAQSLSPAVNENIVQLDEKQRQDTASRIKKALEDFVPPMIELDGKNLQDVFVSARKGRDCSIYFFANCGDKVADFSIKLKEKEPFELWDPTTAQRHCFGKKIVLQPSQSIFAVSGGKENLPQPPFVLNKNIVCDIDSWQLEFLDDNVLYLGLWNVQKADTTDFFDAEGRYKDIGFPVVPPMPAGKIKNFAKPDVRWLPSAFEIRYPATLCYKINFFCYGEPEKMVLLWEQSAIKGRYKVFIDNHEICQEKIRKCRKYDAMNLFLDITDYFRKSKTFYTPHVRTLCVFVDVENPEDGLLEPLRIFGDFLVIKTGDSGMGAEIKAGRISEKTGCKSWTELGYPFYSGSAIYTSDFEIPEISNSRYYLCVEDLFDIAEVELNGKNAGRILWKPYEIEITQFIKKGKNHLRLKVSNSIYNMLEGKPKTSGLISPVQILKGE